MPSGGGTVPEELRNIVAALVVLLEKGADQEPVRWVRVALRIPGGYNTVVSLESLGYAEVHRGGATNPLIGLTSYGVDVARRCS